MRMSIDEFKKRFPHLAKEILEGENSKISLRIERHHLLPDPWRGYTPGVSDYLRRCKSVSEALEVISYLEKRGEISEEEAKEYREIIENKGLSFFGPPKEDDYYYKKAYEYWRKLARRKVGEGRKLSGP
ncbi:MAG: DUF2095 domain-containing protein [Thermoprotei archaeon]|nr:MAG: DUF2095 domain-containing protein [Thermoprotei archaeon]